MGSSFNTGKLQKGKSQFISDNLMGIGSTKINDVEYMTAIRQNRGKKLDSDDVIEIKNNYSTVEKTLNSLAHVDITGLLESINFDKSSNNQGISPNEFLQNSNQIIPSVNTRNQSFDHSIASSSTNHRYSENVMPNYDSSFSQNITNNFNLKGNIIQNDDPSANSSRKNLDFKNFEDLLQIGTTRDEDRFDKSLIRKQIRGVIIV